MYSTEKFPSQGLRSVYPLPGPRRDLALGMQVLAYLHMVEKGALLSHCFLCNISFPIPNKSACISFETGLYFEIGFLLYCSDWTLKY